MSNRNSSIVNLKITFKGVKVNRRGKWVSKAHKRLQEVTKAGAELACKEAMEKKLEVGDAVIEELKNRENCSAAEMIADYPDLYPIHTMQDGCYSGRKEWESR